MLLDSPKVGVQQPRVLSRPPWASSAGVEAIDLAASAGIVLYPWQELEVLVILAEAEDGHWAAFETAVLVARQNGKGEIILVLELAGLFLLGEMLLLHSAHEFKTSKEAFLRIRSVIEGAPHLSRLVKQFRQSNEDTSVELMSGARLRFMARSRQSGRGFSAQRLLVDESQILSRAAMGALMPTLSAQANPQINYFGTVPAPHDDSEHFTSLRDRGRAGEDPYLAWMEHNIGETCADLDDPAAVVAGNPTLGYRISEEFVAKERASLSDEDYARERLSIWSTRRGSTVIDLDRWLALADPKPPKALEVGIGLDITPDRSSGSVSFAALRPDGRRHVEVIDNLPGTSWMVDLVAERRRQRPGCPVMLDASGPAGSLLADLADAGIDNDSGLIVASARDMAQACGAFYDAAMGDPATITHFDQPELNSAIGAARKRPLGDAWAWHRKDTTDISPLVATTLALAALARAPKTKRSGRVW